VIAAFNLSSNSNSSSSVFVAEKHPHELYRLHLHKSLQKVGDRPELVISPIDHHGIIRALREIVILKKVATIARIPSIRISIPSFVLNPSQSPPDPDAPSQPLLSHSACRGIPVP
jgi:hypothetical protein